MHDLSQNLPYRTPSFALILVVYNGFRITLVGYWPPRLPAEWLVGVAANLGPVGVWLGLPAGLATTAVPLLCRFQRSLTE
jgi:MATE family multidrug resistance protein